MLKMELQVQTIKMSVSLHQSKLIIEARLTSTHIFRAYFTKTHLISSPV